MQTINVVTTLHDGATPESDSSTTKPTTTTTTTAANKHPPLSPTPPSSSPYQIDEIVLVLHGNLLYDGKVKKIENRGNQCQYFVHYRGWKKRWDEWVEEDRLMKYNEETLRKNVAINEAKGAALSQAGPGSASQVKLTSPAVVKGKKRKAEVLAEEKGAVPSDKLATPQIPAILKKQLVDDCESVTHLGKLMKLPCSPNVKDVLQKYRDYKLKKDGLVADTVGEFANGLCDYFEKALPAMLLYRSERQQYVVAIKNGVSASKVYGAEHLLRLFVKLPELLASANLEEETLILLQQQVVDFLKFLQKNQSAFFLSTYHVKEDSEMSSNKHDES